MIFYIPVNFIADSVLSVSVVTLIVLGIVATPSADDFESPVIIIGPLGVPAARDSPLLTIPVPTIEVTVAVVGVRPDTAGVPTNRPLGNVIVTVLPLANALDGVIVTVNLPAEVTGEVDVQTAVPLTRFVVVEIQLFELAFHDVPTSQHPGP